MARIEKKILPKYFGAIESGKKKYELRLNDFEVNEGDVLVLREWDSKTKDYTGRSAERTVTYVGKFKIGEEFLLEEEVLRKGIQIISLE